MSNTDQSEKNPQDAARDMLLRKIAAAAEATRNLTPGSGAEALKNLAEAYAFVVSPNQPH